MWFPLIRLLIERCPVRTNEAEQGYFESEQENGLEILYCALITLDCCQQSSLETSTQYTNLTNTICIH